MSVKPRILVVEDESIVAKDLQLSLESLGYNVVGRAASEREAIKMIEQFHPELVLLDIHLKGKVDGIVIGGKIRENFGIPFIFLTAYAGKLTLDRAKATEPAGYIIKPFDERELQAAIEMALYKHQKHKSD